ncbi:hypothetical protein [Streptomyces scopuliridis]|uniref:hypothetical protein n=1 Tax=Streptomyces scopuliridis TaxID=452529 RepID=UPI0036B5D152
MNPVSTLRGSPQDTYHPTSEIRGTLDGHASLFDTTRGRALLGFTAAGRADITEAD